MLLTTERPDIPVAPVRAALNMRAFHPGVAYRDRHASGAPGVGTEHANDVAELVERKTAQRDSERHLSWHGDDESRSARRRTSVRIVRRGPSGASGRG